MVSGYGGASFSLSLASATQNRRINSKSYDILTTKLKLEQKDKDKINSLLPQAFLPPFDDASIVDNIIRIADDIGVRSKLSTKFLKLDDIRDIAYLVLLATRHTITTQELEAYNIAPAHYSKISYYTPHIEEVEIFNFEKSGADMSTKRVNLNAAVWLQKQLGEFSLHNIERIADAYEYLVKRILMFTSDDFRKRREHLRKLIYFETINAVFIKRRPGQKRLIRTIYDKLKESLCQDYDFLHQSVKCDLWEAASDNRLEILRNARRTITVAIGLATEVSKNTGSPGVAITLAHMKFTRATLLSEIVLLSRFKTQEDTHKALESIVEAISSSYNMVYSANSLKERSPERIKQMLSALMYNAKAKSELSKEGNKLFNQAWTTLRGE